MLMINKFEKSADFNFMTKQVNLEDEKIFFYENEYKPSKETIVFLAGSGVSSAYVDMYCLWKPISKEYNVIFYDRPGMGKSSITKRSRGIDAIASDLDTVLNSCKSKGPYIFVAHSMASLEAIRYAQLHKEKVKSIMFIDGASVSFAKEFKDSMRYIAPVMGGARKTGLLRLLCNIGAFSKQFEIPAEIPKEVNQLGLKLTLQNLWNTSMINERKELASNAAVISKAGNLGSLPIYILSADNNGMPDWIKHQEDLSKLSTNVQKETLHSSHFIHYEHTEEVISQIERMTRESK